ncbi:MAG: hypothetical protein ABI180_12245 [Microcoleus sp.]
MNLTLKFAIAQAPKLLQKHQILARIYRCVVRNRVSTSFSAE